MRVALLLAAGISTSLAVVVLLRPRALGTLGTAAGALLETLGATVVFLIANVTVGAGVILLARPVWFYTTLYDVADITFLALSLLQAITVTAWLRLR